MKRFALFLLFLTVIFVTHSSTVSAELRPEFRSAYFKALQMIDDKASKEDIDGLLTQVADLTDFEKMYIRLVDALVAFREASAAPYGSRIYLKFFDEMGSIVKDIRFATEDKELFQITEVIVGSLRGIYEMDKTSREMFGDNGFDFQNPGIKPFRAKIEQHIKQSEQNILILDEVQTGQLKEAIAAAADKPEAMDAIVPFTRDIKCAMDMNGYYAAHAYKFASEWGVLPVNSVASIRTSLETLVKTSESHQLDASYMRFFGIQDEIVLRLESNTNKNLDMFLLTGDFADADLDDVIEFIAKGSYLYFEKRLSNKIERTLTLNFKELSARNILNEICRQFDMQWCVSAGVVLLCDKDRFPATHGHNDSKPLAEKERREYLSHNNDFLPLWKRHICLTLQKKVSVSFIEQPFTKVIEVLAQVIGTKITVAEDVAAGTVNNITFKCADMESLKCLTFISRLAGLKLTIEKTGIVFCKQ